MNIVEKLQERRLLEHQTRAWWRMHHVCLVCLVCTSDAQDGEELCSACREELRSNWLADTDRRMVKATAKCRGDSTNTCAGAPFVSGYCASHSNVVQGLIKPTENKNGWTDYLLAGWVTGYHPRSCKCFTGWR